MIWFSCVLWPASTLVVGDGLMVDEAQFKITDIAEPIQGPPLRRSFYSDLKPLAIFQDRRSDEAVPIVNVLRIEYRHWALES